MGVGGLVDIISHGLIGATIGELANNRTGKVVTWSALFGVLPDILQMLVLYPYIGWTAGRSWFLPLDADWIGFRDTHPLLTLFWEVPHSFLFFAVVVVQMGLWAKIPRIALASYCCHLLIDLPTHTGEWAVAPLWPSPWRFEGLIDPWKWSWPGILAANVVCAAAWWRIRSVRSRTKPT